MGSGYYAQLRTLLLAGGCSVVRQGKGSHEIWHSPHAEQPFTVAVTITSRALANKILKRAGIDQRL